MRRILIRGFWACGSSDGEARRGCGGRAGAVVDTGEAVDSEGRGLRGGLASVGTLATSAGESVSGVGLAAWDGRDGLAIGLSNVAGRRLARFLCFKVTIRRFGS